MNRVWSFFSIAGNSNVRSQKHFSEFSLDSLRCLICRWSQLYICNSFEWHKFFSPRKCEENTNWSERQSEGESKKVMNINPINKHVISTGAERILTKSRRVLCVALIHDLTIRQIEQQKHLHASRATMSPAACRKPIYGFGEVTRN